jgi:hypothetical protein
MLYFDEKVFKHDYNDKLDRTREKRENEMNGASMTKWRMDSVEITWHTTTISHI